MHWRADVRVIRRGAGVGEGPKFHVCGMPTDFSLFRDRLAEAYRVRGTTSNAVCRNIGLGRRRSVDLSFSGLKALDIYRLALRRHDGNDKLANPHAPLHAAALAVRELAPRHDIQPGVVVGQRRLRGLGRRTTIG